MTLKRLVVSLAALGAIVVAAAPDVIESNAEAQVYGQDEACAERFDHEGGEVAAAVAIVRLLRRPPGPLRDAAVRAGARVPAAASHFDALFALYESRLGGARP